MHQGLRQFTDEVSTIMKRDYGLTWQDAAGDLQPLENALADGLSPQEFVRIFAERYDLTPLEDTERSARNA